MAMQQYCYAATNILLDFQRQTQARMTALLPCHITSTKRDRAQSGEVPQILKIFGVRNFQFLSLRGAEMTRLGSDELRCARLPVGISPSDFHFFIKLAFRDTQEARDERPVLPKKNYFSMLPISECGYIDPEL